jgi:ribose 5-phosphate isomerase B
VLTFIGNEKHYKYLLFSCFMKIFIGGDHAGFNDKEMIKEWLTGKYSVEDLGPLSYDKNDDYPDFTLPLASKVVKYKGSFGIVIAGSGIGESIAANKVKGVRAVLYHGGTPGILRTSKVHDNANVLCLGSRFLKFDEMKKAIKLWLGTKFSGALRHKRRLGKIAKYERKRR